MSDDPKKKLPSQGLPVGDFNVRPTVAVRTSNALDTEADRERARRDEEDKRAAQHGGGEGEGDAATEEALSAMDRSIEEARRRAAAPEEEIPILLRDPVTGAAFKLP